MFYKFNAHRAKKHTSEEGDKLARKIYQKLILVQRSCSGFMDGWAQKLTYPSLKLLYILLLSASSSYCAYLIYEGASGLRSSDISEWAESIWPPVAGAADKQQKSGETMRMYLDSLERAVVADSLNQLNHTGK